MDYEKAKHALVTLQAEKRAQQDRLHLASQAKQQLDNNNALRTQFLDASRVI